MSKIALVMQGADFSNLGNGQVRLNIGTKYSVTFPSVNGYTVTPDFVYEGTTMCLNIVPKSGYTFLEDEAKSGTPSAPTVTMGGVEYPCVLKGEGYVCKIGYVNGTVAVSGGSAVARDSYYTVSLALEHIQASLSVLGSAVDSVSVCVGKSKVVYLETAGKYVLPTSSDAFTVENCSIGYVRESDTEGYISIAPTADGSVSGSGLYVEKPTYELTDELTVNYKGQSNSYMVGTGIKPFTSGLCDFTILCKYKASDISGVANYLVKSYIFGCNYSSGTNRGVYLTTNPTSGGTACSLVCYQGGSVNFDATTDELIVYCGCNKSEGVVYYKIYDATTESMIAEGSFTPSSTSNTSSLELVVGGCIWYASSKTYKLGCKATIHNFRYYDSYLSEDSATVNTYFNV